MEFEDLGRGQAVHVGLREAGAAHGACMGEGEVGRPLAPGSAMVPPPGETTPRREVDMFGELPHRDFHPFQRKQWSSPGASTYPICRAQQEKTRKTRAQYKPSMLVKGYIRATPPGEGCPQQWGQEPNT